MVEPAYIFRDLPEEAFPFTIEFFTRTGEVVWSDTVMEPGVLSIPGRHKLGGEGPLGARMHFGNGSDPVEIPPPADGESYPSE